MPSLPTDSLDLTSCEGGGGRWQVGRSVRGQPRRDGGTEGARLHWLVVGQLERAQHRRAGDDDERISLDEVEHGSDGAAEGRDHVRRAAQVIAHANHPRLSAVVARRRVGRRERRLDERLLLLDSAEDGVGERAGGRAAVGADGVEPPFVVHLVHTHHRRILLPRGRHRPRVTRDQTGVIRREQHKGDGIPAVLVVVGAGHAIFFGPYMHRPILPAHCQQHVAHCACCRHRLRRPRHASDCAIAAVPRLATTHDFIV